MGNSSFRLVLLRWLNKKTGNVYHAWDKQDMRAEFSSETPWENLGLDGTIMLKYILQNRLWRHVLGEIGYR